MAAIRVVLAEDHVLVRTALRSLLRELKLEVVAEASDGTEALALIKRFKPDVVLMDIAMSGLDGLETTARLRQEDPSVRVIILSMHASAEFARRALRAGVSGYLLKNSSLVELDLALKAAIRGETYLSPLIAKFLMADYTGPVNIEASSLERLTPRQFEILLLIAKGYSRKLISEKLTISVKTFDTYRAQLMEQLNIHDVAGLVGYATRMGLITSD
ncbi:MAG: response regulator transcription factor [Chloroflexi bacterium]|nr:response regulator transcription factor [Chloroflexota bacterium]OJV88239.1 MAG: DNA-binding response regulator [Chloroflexi bacterium 54-19]